MFFFCGCVGTLPSLDAVVAINCFVVRTYEYSVAVLAFLLTVELQVILAFGRHNVRKLVRY